MKMLSRTSLLFLATCFIFAGCNTTSTIQSVTRDGEDFSRFSSYAFINRDRARTVPGVNPAELMWIPPIVKEKLQSLGYREVPVEEADMLVSIETKFFAFDFPPCKATCQLADILLAVVPFS